MRVQWAWIKALLLFLGLLCKGLAISDPLPFAWGVAAKAVAAIVWIAFDGAFMWLLTPPTEPTPESHV
jgi:hypothetical protein